jgi:hypothetical protein
MSEALRERLATVALPDRPQLIDSYSIAIDPLDPPNRLSLG